MKSNFSNIEGILKILMTGSVIILISGLLYYSSSQNVKTNLLSSLSELSESGANTIEARLKGRMETVQAIAKSSFISNSQISTENKIKELKKHVDAKNFFRISIADLNGNSITTDDKKIYIGDREYFKQAVSGKAYISEPVLSRVDGNKVITFAVPLKDESKKVIGILYSTLMLEVFDEIVGDISFGEGSMAFITDKHGNVIAKKNNYILQSKSKIKEDKDGDFSSFVSDLIEICNGAKANFEFTNSGKDWYVGCSPIEDTNWIIVVSSPEKEMTKKIRNVIGTIHEIILIVILMVVIILIYNNNLKRRLFFEKKTSSQLIEIANIISVNIKEDGTIIDMNSFAEAKSLFSKDEIIGRNFTQYLTEESRKEFLTQLSMLTDKNELKNIELSLSNKDGSILHGIWNLNVSFANTDATRTKTITLTGIDITERVENERKIRESEQRYQLAFEGANDAIWDWNSNDNKVDISDKFYEVIGYDRSEVKDNNYYDLVHPEDIDCVVDAMRKALGGISLIISFEFRIKTKNNDYIWILCNGKSIKDENGRVKRIAGSLTNINERKLNEHVIKQLAYYDLLTGLPNKIILKKETEKAIENALKEGQKGALMFVDLDNFKMINDSFGHYFGDLLIIEISKSLTNILGDSGVVSRAGGDEFVILVSKLDDENTIEYYCEKIMGEFSKNFLLEGNSFYITSSMGVSVFPDDSANFDILLKNVDTALYYAKKRGKRNYKLYNKGLNEEIVEKVNLEKSLRVALTNDEFFLVYQPQIEIETAKIYGFEALIRWNSPQFGLVMPLRFIELAEETGLIVPIGNWVLKKACTFNKEMHDKGMTDLHVSVNISIIQLMQDDFVENVLSIISEVGLDPKFLEIELTESVLIQSLDENLRKLDLLKKSGIRISLDDFGKGYSSLSYLKLLPISTLKIDKSFIDDIGNNKDITGSIVALAHKMELSVIAEGVETKEQMEYLVKNKCNMVQGYYIGKPMIESEAVKIVNLQNV